MMDTGAIYLEVCNYGRACRAGNIMDEADHMQMIASLLRNADEEHKSLLAENERLVDEVAELKAAYESQFKELHELKAELERIKALEPVAVRYDFDGYGWQYVDGGSGSDWLTRHEDGEVLYALGSNT